MSAADLWSAVVSDYDQDGLITLTNIRNRSATSINTSVGEAAAQAVINLWPVYAQADYDPTNQTHVEVAEMGVIAMLWRRGGTSSAIEQVKWDEVFGDDGLITRVRRTGARGRVAPTSNSGVQQAPERDSGGRMVRGWADAASLPPNYLPLRRTVDGDR